MYQASQSTYRTRFRPWPTMAFSTILLAVLLVLLAPFGQAQAQGVGRIFTIYGIPVDERAGSTAAARAAAIDRAQQRAFVMLMQKILDSDDLDRVTRPDAAQMRTLVRGFEVAGERSSATRYLGNFTVAFDPNKIRAYLARFGVPYSEIAPKPLVVLPVYWRGGAAYLWEGDNPWAMAWAKSDYRNRLMEYKLAQGGMRDELEMPVSAIREGLDEAQLKAFLARHHAADVLIAVVEETLDPDTRRPGVRFSFRQGFEGPYENGRIQATPGDSGDDLLARAADAIMTRLDARWREMTLIRSDEVSRLKVSVPAEKIETWVAVRERLGRVPIVRGIIVDHLRVPKSEITIRFVGGLDRLKLSLVQQELALNEGVGEWLLELE